MAEADVIDISRVFSAKWRTAREDIGIFTRLLPIQVLGRRATNAAFKYRSLLRMLHLEVGDVEIAKQRTRSFLNDMGTESKLALVPEIDVVDLDRRAFNHALPLHDLDHGMHHVMQELLDCWPELGAVFDRQLNALSKYFSKRDNAERFCKMRIWDSNLPHTAKSSLSKILLHTCPVFVGHRWEYRFNVLSWVCEREQLLLLLDPASVASSRTRDEDDRSEQNDFTDSDVEALRLLYSDPTSLATFWALAYSMLLLCRWGHDLVAWMHGCWCHPTKESRDELKKNTGKPCPWNGRRLIELSCGASVTFVQALRALSTERDKHTLQKLQLLRDQGNNSIAEQIVQGFVTAKHMLEGRYLQLTSFLQEVPWNLVKLLRFLICPGNDVPKAMAESRADAAKLLSDCACGRLVNIGDVGIRFLKKPAFVQGLRRWAKGLDVHMNNDVFRELVAYGTSLLVMQRLEAKHHLVHATWLVQC